jgi:O-antigen ligase
MSNLTGRVELWPFCFDMLREEPLFGMGVGSFNQYLYDQNVLIQGEPWKHFGHNVFYEFIGELGVVGSVLMFGGLLAFYVRSVSLMRSSDTNQNQKFLLTFSVAVQTICLVYCASGNVLLYPQEIFPWFIGLAITTTVYNNIKRKKGTVRKMKYTEAYNAASV